MRISGIIFLLSIGWVFAQDPHFSQFYASPLYINPGFTGATDEHRFITNMRLQWPSLPKAFNTYAFSYDHNMSGFNSGIGLLVSADQAGSAGQLTTNAGLLYSYKLQLNRKVVISPGLYFGFGNRTLDISKAVFGDQLGRNGVSDDPAARDVRTARWLDVGTGLIIYSKKYWFGFSGQHLNNPNQSLLTIESRLPVKYSVHGGARIPLYQGLREKSRISSLAPAFVYQQQGNFSQLDVGLHFIYDPVVTGLWFRGAPLFKEEFGGEVSRDAVVFVFGLRYDFFDIGYSYDFTISRVGPAGGGAHELSLQVLLSFPESNRMKKKDKVLPCPAFPSRD